MLLVGIIFVLIVGIIVALLLKKATPKEEKKSSIIIEEKKVSSKNNDSSSEKGEELEIKIANLISKYIPDAKIIRNLILATGSGSTEIDIIALSTKGLFVIESKNYSGLIVSNSIENKKWRCYYGKKIFKEFYSPILQNEGHLKAIKNLNNVTSFKFDSLVVFGEKATLGEKIKEDERIFKVEELDLLLKRFSKKEDIYKEGAIESLYKYLISFTYCSREEHIKYVKDVIK